VNRATLLEWGTAVGFSRGYVRTILSEILCAKGKRARAPGAGPKTSELAKEWYTRAEQEIGAEMAWRVLNSASRWGKALEAQRASGKIVALPERQTIQRKAS
jgi:hypothetical protein